MADDYASQLPPDESISWLARNRKIAILVGLVILLGAAVVVTAVIPRGSGKTNTAAVGTNPASNAASPTNTYDRPTFQRYVVPDVPNTIPPAYKPPTNADLQNAINQLSNTSSNH